MQHTVIPTDRLVFWAALIVSESVAALSTTSKSLRPLRHYLVAEAAIGGVLWILSRTIPAWPYFYCWCVAGIFDQAASGYLLFSIFRAVKARGLPERRNIKLLPIATFLSLAAGIYSSGTVMSHVQPIWKITMAWDHAFWFAMCCLVALVPLYTWFLYSTLRGLGLVFTAFAVYAITHAGLFDLMVLRARQANYVWISDWIYFACVVAWFLAGRLQSRSHHTP